ncbi:unnamed protein product [Rotaria sordida]|uniref:Uncharacterized protein n=1 Tax=Rotaria sordida TaxID=392033 RepID=A0A813UR34_9BILA|nr:unnamed protein product [Rotaria sordida]CAF1550776.1 unnamed protein product [Rotaria sordida]
MSSARFHYTGNDDTVRCDTYALEVSGWTLEMKPFVIHAKHSPACTFICFMLPTERTNELSAMSFTPAFSTSNDGEESSKSQNAEIIHDKDLLNRFDEVETLKQIRKRTYSDWPHRTSPSSEQMIEAGFFNCNVGDRAICLYCNLICQQWTPHTDDPYQIHKIISPKCPYIITKLRCDRLASSNDRYLSQRNFELDATAHHKEYVALKIRYVSFATWPNKNLPAVDDLVRAGFVYTGSKTVVTCFYCNGSLQNWRANDNSTIEHVRWFPHCAYARQLCGVELYRKIKESKQRREEHENYQKFIVLLEVNDVDVNNESVAISDNDLLARIVDAYLDLPISQNLLGRNFKLSIIRHCWKDQLLSKYNDFASDSDLLMACITLQKQAEYINRKGENIIVPSPVPKDQTDSGSPLDDCA